MQYKGIKMSTVSVKAHNLSKLYHLYPKAIDRLKEALHPLRKQYHHDFFALKNISFEINKGETFGIIGRNGAGKSTLLKILTGVLTQTNGEIFVNGKISALLELGAGFNPEMTGMENVFFSGTIMGFEPEEMSEKLDDILAFADIGEFIDQPVKTYSSGMFARLAFAIAANVDPDILIVDEALAVGDFNFQAKCFARFKEFQERGKTIIFVSHDLNSVITYCTKAMLIEKGEHIISGTPKEVVDAYKRILVGLPYDAKTEDTPSKQIENLHSSLDMKKNFNINKDATNYGNGSADIIDYGIFDKKGNPSQKVITGEEITIAMTVRINNTIENPIFACTIKDVKGLDITGSNTLFENVTTGELQTGSLQYIEFKFKNQLKPGGYFISFGVTNYTAEDFVVYARSYDILSLEVISDKNFVGFFDSEMKITVRENIEC
jgi:teichoic acid transport system ATP-binding protein